jgi:hypothetical protein
MHTQVIHNPGNCISDPSKPEDAGVRAAPVAGADTEDDDDISLAQLVRQQPSARNGSASPVLLAP